MTCSLLRRERPGSVAEQVVLQFEVLEQHLGVEQVLLVHVHVGHLVGLARVVGEIVLDRVDLVVDEMLAPLDVAGEAADPIVDRDDVRVELVDQVVQGLQRGDHSAGGHIDVHAEGRDAVHRMDFRVGMHGDVALVQVRQDGVRQRARGLFDLAVGRSDRLLGDQDGHAGALGVVVLTRDVQDIGADDVDNIGKNLRQTLRVILFVDVLHVGLEVFGRLGVADVVDVEAQGLRQVVEPVELEFAFHRGELSRLLAALPQGWGMPVRCERRTCVGRLTPLRDGDCGLLSCTGAGWRHWSPDRDGSGNVYQSGRIFRTERPPDGIARHEKRGALCRANQASARVCAPFMMTGCRLSRVRRSRSRG